MHSKRIGGFNVHVNSDLSGDAIISGPDDTEIHINAEKLLEYLLQFRQAAVTPALPRIERLEVTRVGKRVEHTDHFPVENMYMDGKTLKVRFTDGGNAG